MIIMPLPFVTFGEIKDAGYEVEVWCQRCHRQSLLKLTMIFVTGRSPASASIARAPGTTGRPARWETAYN